MNEKEGIKQNLEKIVEKEDSSNKTPAWFKIISSWFKEINNKHYSPLFKERNSKLEKINYEKEKKKKQLNKKIRKQEQKQKLKQTITDNKIIIENITQECATNFNEYVANFKKGATNFNENVVTYFKEDVTNFSERMDKIEEGIRDRYYKTRIRSKEFKNTALDYISDYKKKIVKATEYIEVNKIVIHKKDIKENKEKTNSNSKKPFYKRPITYLTASLAAAIIAGGLTIGYYTTDLNKKNSVVPTPKQAVEEVINEANALLAQKDLYIELAAAQDKFSKLVEPEREYTVQKGDNLIKIGAKYDSNIYKKMNEWCKKNGKHPLFPNYVHADGSPVFDNDKSNPNIIKPGQKIDVTYLQEEAIKSYEAEKVSLEKRINELSTALDKTKTEKTELSKKQTVPAENKKATNASDYRPLLAGIAGLFSADAFGMEIKSESSLPSSIDSVVSAAIPSHTEKININNSYEKTNYYAAHPDYVAIKESNISGKKPIYGISETPTRSENQMINDYFNNSLDKKTVKSINKEYSADIYSVLKKYKINWTRTAEMKEKKLDRILNSAYLKNEEGLSARNISEELGISVSTVYADLRNYNALIRNDIRNEQTKKENNINIQRMYA